MQTTGSNSSTSSKNPPLNPISKEQIVNSNSSAGSENPPPNSIPKVQTTGSNSSEETATNNEGKEELICPFTYPNYETEDYWRTSIPFLGTPTFQSTSIWENYKVMKNQGKVTNQKNVSKDVLTNEGYERARHFEEDQSFGNIDEGEDDTQSCN